MASVDPRIDGKLRFVGEIFNKTKPLFLSGLTEKAVLLFYDFDGAVAVVCHLLDVGLSDALAAHDDGDGGGAGDCGGGADAADGFAQRYGLAWGEDGLLRAATMPEADCVITAVVGMVGLKPTLAAIRAKKRIGLANKERLYIKF